MIENQNTSTTSAQTNGSSTVVYLPLRDQMALNGYFYLAEIFVTIFYIPMSFIGLILSILCVVVFFKKEFKLPMYDYFRVYSISNCVICFVSIFNALTTPYQIISFANTYVAIVYSVYVFLPVGNLCYFFNTILDIAMILDRIGIFVPRMKLIFSSHPYKLSGLIFLVCTLIDAPYFFLWLPTSFELQLSDTDFYTVYSIDYTEFGYSKVGTIIVYIQYVLRDTLPTILIFIFSSISVVLLRSHLKKKSNLIFNHTHTNTITTTTATTTSTSISTGFRDGNAIKATQTAKQNNKLKENVKFTLLVYLISILTATQNMFTIASILAFQIGSSLGAFAAIAQTVTWFFLVFKAALQFFIFYFLNSIFNKKFNKMFFSLFSIFRHIYKK